MCRDIILEQGRELCEYGCIWEATKLYLRVVYLHLHLLLSGIKTFAILSYNVSTCLNVLYSIIIISISEYSVLAT